MLTKSVSPKTKAELIRALQSATFRKVEVFEGDRLSKLPSANAIRRAEAIAVILS